MAMVYWQVFKVVNLPCTPSYILTLCIKAYFVRALFILCNCCLHNCIGQEHVPKLFPFYNGYIYVNVHACNCFKHCGTEQFVLISSIVEMNFSPNHTRWQLFFLRVLCWNKPFIQCICCIFLLEALQFFWNISAWSSYRLTYGLCNQR